VTLIRDLLRVHRPRAVRFALMACAVLAACDDDPMRPEREALAAAEARWNAVRPASNSYVMMQQRSCFCPVVALYEVTVVNNVIVRARNTATDVDLPSAQWVWFRTVSQLFDEVRMALRKDGVLRSVAYDNARGFPTTVSLDPIPQAIDDEIAYLTPSLNFSP
jgi:Family of unknown function (DUF6174)